MSAAFVLLFMLFTGHVSTHSTHSEHYGSTLDDELSTAEQEQIFAQTLDILMGKQVAAKKNKPMYSEIDHLVQSPVDDEDLDLVLDYQKDFDKTGQLRYASVPVIEEQLVNEILDVMFSRKEYIRYLNSPHRDQMEVSVREMLRVPTQEVLQQQLLHKILAGRAYYVKYIQPMIEDNKRQKLLDFAEHLLEAHANGTLSTKDTVQFNEKMKNYAFFDRPDDVEFKEKVDKLQEVFGRSMNVTVKPDKRGNSTGNQTFVPDTTVDESDDDISEDLAQWEASDSNATSSASPDDITTESTNTTDVEEPTTPWEVPTTEVPTDATTNSSGLILDGAPVHVETVSTTPESIETVAPTEGTTETEDVLTTTLAPNTTTVIESTTPSTTTTEEPFPLVKAGPFKGTASSETVPAKKSFLSDV